MRPALLCNSEAGHVLTSGAGLLLCSGLGFDVNRIALLQSTLLSTLEFPRRKLHSVSLRCTRSMAPPWLD